MAENKVVKLMSASLDEFQRSLVRLRPDADVGPGKHDFIFQDEVRRVHITVVDLPPKVVGTLLRLPQIEVTLCFDGYDDVAKADFLATFDQAFQRGGG